MSDSVKTVCLLGFGEVGSTLAEDLLDCSDVRLVVWDKLFPEEGSLPDRRFARFANVSRVARAKKSREAVVDADLVISAVTADQDVAAAESVQFAMLPHTWFLDLNSVSPGTKLQAASRVVAGGGRYIEAAVMAPIAPRRINTDIILSGNHADQFLPVAHSLGFGGMRVLSARPGQAAASKMCRSVVVKGMEALITEALLAARYYGVEDEVIESLGNLLPHPDWRRQAAYMISRSLQHGNRRAEEMREVVTTVREAGIAPWMSEACVQRQSWAGNLPVSLDPLELSAMLDEMRNIQPTGNIIGKES